MLTSFESALASLPERRRTAARLLSASRNISTRRSRCTAKSLTLIALSSRSLLAQVLATEANGASGEGTNLAGDFWRPGCIGPKSNTAFQHFSTSAFQHFSFVVRHSRPHTRHSLD